MSEFLSRLLIVSNATEECENVSRSNTDHLNAIPGLRVYKVAIIALPMINFVMNSVSFAVFRSLRRGNAFHGILMWLAASDALFQLVFSWLQLLLYLMECNVLMLPSLGAALLVAGSMSASMYTVTVLHLLRNWLVVLISYYRHRTTSGLRSGKGCLLSRPVRPKAAGFVLACLAVSLPRCFEFSVVTCAPLIQVTHIVGYLNNRIAYQIAYQGVVLFLVQSVGPFLLLIYFSAVLCLRLRRQQATRRTLTTAPVRQQSSSCTRLVALLCAAFLICETPTALSKVVDPMHSRLHMMGYVGNLMVCLDSTLNCLIYGFANRQFSQALQRRFRHCKAPVVELDMADMAAGRRHHRLLGNGTDRHLETAVLGQDGRTSVQIMHPIMSAPSAL